MRGWIDVEGAWQATPMPFFFVFRYKNSKKTRPATVTAIPRRDSGAEERVVLRNRTSFSMHAPA
jgi:hypothetical protein